MKSTLSESSEIKISNTELLRYYGAAFSSRLLRFLRLRKIGMKIKKGCEEKINRRLRAQNVEGGQEPVKRVQNLTPEDFYQNYYLKSRPVVVEGACKDWQAVKQWNIEFFKTHYGHCRLGTHKMTRGGALLARAVCTIQEIADKYKSGDELYYAVFTPIFSKLPELKNAIDPGLLRRYANISESQKMWTNMFMGPRHSVTSSHNSAQSNLFVQIDGKKRWFLIPPDQDPLIYPDYHIPLGMHYLEARFDRKRYSPFEDGRLSADYEEFPLAKYIKAYETVIGPGDLLFIPAFYWHRVENLTDSIGLSTWWHNPRMAFKNAPFHFLLCAYSIIRTSLEIYDVAKFDDEYFLNAVHT